MGRLMNRKVLMITAMAMLAIGASATSARAGVVGPAPAVQTTAHSLDLVQQTRRICRRVLRCPKFLQCHMQEECYITSDYPPEHNRR
jgi:hypothetical protein